MTQDHTTPQVSILMLTYNRARFIKDAIGSVLSQTYQNWELIIIDDGSTDDTAAIVASFSDRRITYIRHTENSGLLSRRQESLTRATGAYVAVLDSDDIWSSTEKLAKQVQYLNENPSTALVGTWLTLVDEEEKIIKQDRYHCTDKKIRNTILCRNQFAHSSVLMRRDLITRTDGYRFPLAEDLDLFLQLGTLGTFANLPEYLTSYRIHQNSETKKKRALLDAVLSILATHRKSYPWYWCGAIKYSLYRLLTR